MFTVAVKRENTLVQFCGLYDSPYIARQSAKGLRESWENSAMPGPTSIRVRQVDEDQFWQNQREHGYTGTDKPLKSQEVLSYAISPTVQIRRAFDKTAKV